MTSKKTHLSDVRQLWPSLVEPEGKWTKSKLIFGITCTLAQQKTTQVSELEKSVFSF